MGSKLILHGINVCQCVGIVLSRILNRFRSPVSSGAKRLGTAVRSYLGTLRWFSIPASVGFAYVCYQQFWHIKEREERKLKAGESVEPSQWQVRLRDWLRDSSRHEINLWISFLKLVVCCFLGCLVQEAAYKSLFPCLGQIKRYWLAAVAA